MRKGAVLKEVQPLSHYTFLSEKVTISDSFHTTWHLRREGITQKNFLMGDFTAKQSGAPFILHSRQKKGYLNPLDAKTGSHKILRRILKEFLQDPFSPAFYVKHHSYLSS